MILERDEIQDVRSTDSLPPELAAAIERDGFASDSLQAAAATDLLSDGRFGEEWLVAAGGRLLVYSPAGAGWRLRESLPLTAELRARVEPLTCGGELAASVGGMPRGLVRFTAARFADFTVLAARLAALAEGKRRLPAEDSESGGRSRCASCARALEPGSRTCPHCANKGRVLWRLVRLTLPYRRKVMIILALLLAGVAIALVPPYLVRVLVDEVLASGRNPGWLLPVVLGLFGLHALYALCNVLHGRLAVQVGSQLTTDLRQRLFAHLTRLSVSFYDRTQVGTLMTRVAQDTEELHTFIAQALGGFLVPAVTALGIGAMLFWLQPSLALCVLAPLPLVGLGMWLFWRSVSPRHDRYWRTRARINAFLNTCFSGIRVVKAFGQEGREHRSFEGHNEVLRGARVSVDQIWTVFFPWVILAFQASGLLVWYFGGRAVLGRDITLGTLMAFLGYLGMLHGPLSVLSQIGQWLTRSLTSAQRIFEMLDRTPEIADPESPAPLGRVRGEIEFRNVTFGYAPGQPVIRNLSFRVRPGEVVGVVGRSGAGKTTLAGLLARFYDPQGGQVLLDGRDVRTIASADLSAHVGLVLQEPFIFRGTLTENIAYGRPEAARETVLRAAAAGDCHGFVARMPLGYDSEVGERGAGLSGGEKQRVSIARAILHDPEVLVLDEATSSLDTEAERIIHESLGRLVEGRTTIVIAHRLVTLRGCDRILVMDRGRLVEEGTHEELLARPGGIYRGLVESQERPPRERRAARKQATSCPAANRS